MGKDKLSIRADHDLSGFRRLPEEVTTETIMEELYFKQQVDDGLQNVAEGRGLTHQELKGSITRWRKSLGH